jgi:hypothetical protein
MENQKNSTASVSVEFETDLEPHRYARLLDRNILFKYFVISSSRQHDRFGYILESNMSTCTSGTSSLAIASQIYTDLIHHR